LDTNPLNRLVSKIFIITVADTHTHTVHTEKQTDREGRTDRQTDTSTDNKGRWNLAATRTKNKMPTLFMIAWYLWNGGDSIQQLQGGLQATKGRIPW